MYDRSASAYDRLMRGDPRRAQLVRTLQRLTSSAHTELGNIQVYDPTQGALRIVTQRGFERDFLDHFDTVTADDGSACARALLEPQVFIPDVNLDAEYEPHRGIAERAGYRAVMSAAIRGTNGVAGMLSFHFQEPRPATARDREVASHFAPLLAPLLAPLVDGRGDADPAEEVRAAFADAVRVVDLQRAVARRRGEPISLEVTPALELSVRRFAREHREAGAPAEGMLRELKQALSEERAPLNGDLRREIFDAAITLGIRGFYDDEWD